jgi:hypothetical protein
VANRHIRFTAATMAVFCWSGLVQAQQLPNLSPVATILWRTPSRQSLSIQKQLNFLGNFTADSAIETEGRSTALITILSGTVSLERLATALLSAV